MTGHPEESCKLPRRLFRRTGTVVACRLCHRLYVADWSCAADQCIRHWTRLEPKP